MCVRFTVWELSEFMDYYILEKPADDLKPRYNAAPGQNIPVITKGKADKNKLEIMRFGLIPSWAKDEKMGYKLLNARAESIFEKPTWKNLIKTKRCIIPTNGYYEWSGEKPNRQPFFIHLTDRSLFSLAGLHNSWTDIDTGEIIDTFSIITTAPNDKLARIHNRMPVILHRDDEAGWLSPKDDEGDLQEMLLPYEQKDMEAYKVSKDVGKVANDYPELINKIA